MQLLFISLFFSIPLLNYSCGTLRDKPRYVGVLEIKCQQTLAYCEVLNKAGAEKSIA